ncbi:MAG: hypothetical protein Q8N90_03350 [bacterium]|nr:hypothetical protein [bacterium]
MKKAYVLVMVLVLMCSLAFAVQGTIKLKVLGRAPLSKSVLDAETARQAIKDEIEEIRKLQGDEFILDLADQVDRIVFREENILVGERMEWMLFRDKAKRVRNIKNVEWSGEEPFKAFGFEIVHAGKFYHMFVAQKCGNISLCYTRGPAQHFTFESKALESKKDIPVPAKLALSPVAPAPAPIPVLTKRHYDNLKLKFGYAQDQIDILGPDFKLNEQSTLQSYLPLPSYFYFCENDDSGWLYSPYQYLDYIPGDRLWLKNSRVASVRQSGMAFTAGLELRLWKNLWFSADYFQARKTRLDIQENLEDLEVKRLDYLGYYPISSTYVYYFKFGRQIIDYQTSITGFSRELDLTLKWLLETGRVSVSPVIGIACRQFVQERKEDYFISFLYPWKGEVVSLSEVHGEDKFQHYDHTVVAGLAGELRVLKPIALGVDVWYRKFPNQAVHFQSLFIGTDWSFHSNPWRVTASLKLVI